MKRFRTLLGFGILPLLLGCPTSPPHDVNNYRHQVFTFKIDPVPADHPFCTGGITPFATPAECRQASKYRLSWQRPEDTTGLIEYRVYLDTNPPDAPGQTWAQVRKDRSRAALIMPGSGGLMDSVIFIVGAGGFRLDTLTRSEARIVALDTSGRIDSLGRLMFAITADYRESGLDGLPSYTWMITNDRFAPYPVQPRYTDKDRSLEIAWSRPPDHISFFDRDPAADTGIIREYVLQVARGGVISASRPGFNPQVNFVNGGTDLSAQVESTSYVADGSNGIKGARAFRFLLPDSQRVFNRLGPDPRDSLAVIVSGLSPQDTVDIFLWPVDAAGNRSDTIKYTRVILTDTTEPLAPRLRPLDTGEFNRFAYGFTASRDLVVDSGSGVLVPAPFPNANIREYKVRRLVLGGYAGGPQNQEATLLVTSANRNETLFVDTVRFLPPGTTYRIFVQATDSTGHLSPLDSLDVSTRPVRFTGPESNSTCPAGFVAMPAGRFLLGDTSAEAESDERNGWRRRYIGSFCVEPHEHGDSTTGGFRSKVTWQQADQACRDLSPSDSSHLCTEAEWERACEGIDSLTPLLYGVQSEKSNSGGVINICNIGTDDSAMAMTPSLRNPACLTYEGAFDLSGNLAEWVADRYDLTSPYGAYTQAGDTLFPGTPLTPPAADSLHGFRGWHYLKDNISSAATLRLARCSNRDYPLQIRPRPYAGCLDTAQPQLVVLYGAKPPRCLPIADSLVRRGITSVSLARDSTQILFFLAGLIQPFIYTLPVGTGADSIYAKARPSDDSLTRLKLAAVTFVNSQTGQIIPDTLDAVEMLRDTSQAALSIIFNREVSPPWVARQSGGRYEIRYLYAYSRLGGVPARPQYSNVALGFRCCSRPRP